MTIPTDQFPGPVRALAFLIRRIRLRKKTVDETLSKIALTKPKRRSHRTTAFFEMP